MNLFKTSIYTSISTAVGFISAFIITKVVSQKIGPAGLAFVGQFQNVTAILAMLATGAINTGVIKYLATYKTDKAKQQQVITTSLTIVICCSLCISLFVIVCATYLSNFSFHTPDLWIVFILYGSFISLTSLNILFASFFNGLKNIKNLTITNIATALTGVLITVIFAEWLGLKGILIAGNFTSLIVFAINIFFLKKIAGFHFKPDFKKWDNKIIRMLLAFALMNIVSGLLGPCTQILVRDKIIKDFSTVEAGYWQAITRISDYYLSFITTVLAVYYLPRLSEIEKQELRKEIMKGYKTILPVVIILSFLIWICKDLVVQIVFTQKFLPMIPLFKYQLLGDVLKIGSWLLAFLMLSKALNKNIYYN